jgi:hypothetical protein
MCATRPYRPAQADASRAQAAHNWRKGATVAKLYEGITPELIDWVGQQHLFFVGSAPLSADGHVNCSPNDLDTLARWADAKKVEGLTLYRKQHNARSIDGLPGLDSE